MSIASAPIRLDTRRAQLRGDVALAARILPTHYPLETFIAVNPLAGLTWKISAGVSAFGGYSQANRAPTPLELDCANPNLPCLLEGALVSDPPLAQVVSHSYQAGLRGRVLLGAGSLDWSASLFRTDSDNDIVALASVIAGRGYFTNVPSTQRQGVDLTTRYATSRWSAAQ